VGQVPAVPGGGGGPTATRISRTLRLLVDEWGWPVTPGTYLTDSGACSCGDRRCPEPGRHASADRLGGSRGPGLTRSRGRASPLAAVVLPVGSGFDLRAVPPQGGRDALNRLESMGYRLPPVIATDAGRLLFFVSAADRRASGPDALAPALVDAVDLTETSDSPDPGSGAPISGASGASAGAASRRVAGEVPADTAIWVGGGVPCIPDVVVRRGGLVVAPALGPESPGTTRWLLPPAPARHPLPRTEDVLGPKRINENGWC